MFDRRRERLSAPWSFKPAPLNGHQDARRSRQNESRDPDHVFPRRYQLRGSVRFRASACARIGRAGRKNDFTPRNSRRIAARKPFTVFHAEDSAGRKDSALGAGLLRRSVKFFTSAAPLATGANSAIKPYFISFSDSRMKSPFAGLSIIPQRVQTFHSVIWTLQCSQEQSSAKYSFPLNSPREASNDRTPVRPVK